MSRCCGTSHPPATRPAAPDRGSRHRLTLAQQKLDAVSPLATLARGFAVVTHADGRVITDAGTVAVGEEIHALLHRGTLRARVTGQGPGNNS